MTVITPRKAKYNAIEEYAYDASKSYETLLLLELAVLALLICVVALTFHGGNDILG